MFKFQIKTYFNIILIFSLIALISAFFIEYVLGHQPCNLCLIERIPYALTILTIILFYFLNKNEKFFIIILILIFTFSLIVSIYHFGIEQGFFKESFVCTLKDSMEIMTKEDILKQLNEKNISCKDVTFRIFGLSLTSINIFISLIFLLNLTFIFKNYDEIKE